MPEEATKNSVLSRLWRWLKFGRSSGSSGSFGYHPVKQGRWRIPGRLLTTLNRYRRIMPTPLTYIAVGTLGLVVGIVLQLVFGLWWWIFPIVFIVTAWTIFLTSIWRHPFLDKNELQIDLITVINPEKGQRLRRENQQKLLRSSKLPLYTVSFWPGKMSLGGWGGSPGTISSISVALHESSAAIEDQFSPPIIQIGTLSVDERDEEGPKSQLRSELLSEIQSVLLDEQKIMLQDFDFADPVARNRFHEQSQEIFEQAVALGNEIQWSPTTMNIDGQSLPAQQVTAAGVTGKYCKYDGFWVYILAPEGEKYKLSRVSNPEILYDRFPG